MKCRDCEKRINFANTDETCTGLCTYFDYWEIVHLDDDCAVELWKKEEENEKKARKRRIQRGKEWEEKEMWKCLRTQK